MEQLSFTLAFVHTLLGIILCSIGSIILLLLTIMHSHYLIKHAKSLKFTDPDTDSTIHTVTHILTAIYIALQFFVVMSGIAEYTEIILHFIDCDEFRYTQWVIMMIGIYLRWIVFLYRLRGLYINTAFDYGEKKLKIYMLLLFAVILVFAVVPGFYFFSRAPDPTVVIPNALTICSLHLDLMTPWAICIGIIDTVMALICIHLLLRPIAYMQARSTASLRPEVQLTETANRTSESGTSDVVPITSSHQSQRAAFLALVQKHFILTFWSAAASAIVYPLIICADMMILAYLDNIINSFCLAFMANWYDTETNRLYKYVCCGLIRCTKSKKCCVACLMVKC